MGEHLTPLDATFLELEEIDQSAHMHIGAVMIFEPRPRGAPRLETLRRHLEARLDQLPRFHQRLSEPRTGGLSWPSWEQDDRFDIAGHLRRASLPAPGGERQLLDWSGEFFSERLDRARPLWEMAVIEGLADGRWALATKTHHCMVDGVGSVDIGNVILDASPHPRRRPVAQPPAAADGAEAGEDHAPDALRRLAGIPVKLAKAPVKLAGSAVRLGGAGLGVARHPDRAREALHRSRAMAKLVLEDEVIAAPRTSLNLPIGAKRRLAVARVPLAELKEIRARRGGTVNDVVLAVTAGGLRALLIERGEDLPARGLRAMVPVNVRDAGEQLALGNKITSLFVHLPVAEPDTAARYEQQMEEAESLKSGTQALGARTMIDLTSLAPPALHSFMARALYATRLFNLTVTNVPGPRQPLYAFGSRLEAVWPLVPLAAEHALGVAVFSYDGDLFFTLNADHDTVPDLETVIRGIKASVAELKPSGEAPPGV